MWEHEEIQEVLLYWRAFIIIISRPNTPEFEEHYDAIFHRRKSPFTEGILRGKQDRDENLPEPYPPYEIGTPEANEWIRGYRVGVS